MSLQQSSNESGYRPYIPSLPMHPKYLNDAGYLRTIKIERRGRIYRMIVLNTNRKLVKYKDHASLEDAKATANDLVLNGSWD